MPFAKGNKLWKEGLKVRKEKDEKIIDVLFGDLGEGGAEAYGEKLERLAQKKKLTDEEKEFMDRYEKLLEYFKPKLARTESRVEVTGSLFGLGHDELKKDD